MGPLRQGYLGAPKLHCSEFTARIWELFSRDFTHLEGKFLGFESMVFGDVSVFATAFFLRIPLYLQRMCQHDLAIPLHTLIL